MKKILNSLLIIGLLILLPGCGVINICNFIMPDDLEFLETVKSLDTPKKISDYMIENFVHKAHYFIGLNPYQLYLTKKGDCNDFSLFGKFIANYHDYQVYEINIIGNSLMTHYICVYEEELSRGKYSLTTNQYYYSRYKTFRETVIRGASTVDMNWKKYIVYDYDNNIIEKGEK